MDFPSNKNFYFDSGIQVTISVKEELVNDTGSLKHLTPAERNNLHFLLGKLANDGAYLINFLLNLAALSFSTARGMFATLSWAMINLTENARQEIESSLQPKPAADVLDQSPVTDDSFLGVPIIPETNLPTAFKDFFDTFDNLDTDSFEDD